MDDAHLRRSLLRDGADRRDGHKLEGLTVDRAGLLAILDVLRDRLRDLRYVGRGDREIAAETIDVALGGEIDGDAVDDAVDELRVLRWSCLRVALAPVLGLLAEPVFPHCRPHRREATDRRGIRAESERRLCAGTSCSWDGGRRSYPLQRRRLVPAASGGRRRRGRGGGLGFCGERRRSAVAPVPPLPKDGGFFGHSVPL